tara:strand:- start:3459 stop:5177 length:1719 start_codon:yes stop_codon:yes gene_type:complete
MFLGVSAYFHDSSVCLLNERGEIIDFIKEEWLSRVKGDSSFPRMALEKLIITNQLSKKNLKKICFYEKPFRAWLTIAKHTVKTNKLNNELTRNYFKNVWKSSVIFQYHLSKFPELRSIPVEYCEHHLSHTLTSLFYSGAKPSVSIVVDGYGDKYCSSIHHIKSSTDIEQIWSSEYPNSLGLFYSAITDFLGFAVNEGEYKVMGLAAYGEPKYAEKLKETIYIKSDELILNTSYFDFVRSIKQSYSKKLISLIGFSPREPHAELDMKQADFKSYADLASSAQKVTEDLLLEIFNIARKKTNKSVFHFSGGVAMNSVAVMKISNLSYIEKLHIPPSPGDSGAAMGSAYYSYLKSNKRSKPRGNEFLETNLFPGQFSRATKTSREFLATGMTKICGANEAIDEIANLIKKDEIVATCYKNIETGPRALGQRSLICNGHNKNLIKKLNTKIKNRSSYRPTSPAVLEKNANKYFNINKKFSNLYKIMSITATVKQTKKSDIKGVTHADGTARVQLCDKNSLLGKILSALEKEKVLILANTSFNVSSDPMVYDFEDALLSMIQMKINYIFTEEGLYKR